ncbi:hypothetical protein FJT64_016354 [Amphibalanus amphitrite]|uniref:G-protein coupled receptors family 1 profile domain-containing protein n=1 Tax=Amphibalanus amphitrite TaxID=1232801 RepID=A0A6A4X423_AMPAM|nr:hypothetical protein FJT64_016354 [Amphibalanus amphitrite]
MIAWGRIGVPAALMVLFAVPLIVIIKSRTIREEPMVLLILNMTAVLVSFNALFFVISIVDAVTANSMPHLLCSFLLSTGLAVFGGFKLSTLLLAAEQYVAVVFSLQHFTIMSRWVNKMIAFTWLFIVGFSAIILLCFFLGLETIAEFDLRVFGIDHHINTCGWQKVANMGMFAFQIVFFLFTILTCGLLTYTAVQGLKHEKRIAGDNTSRQTENFVLRFKSFRRIVKLLLIFLIIDIIGTVIHIISRWFPVPTLFTYASHFVRTSSLVVEYWAYGISNAIIPKAIKKFFGFRRNHREPQGRPADSVPPRQPPAAGPIAMIEVEANGTS